MGGCSFWILEVQNGSRTGFCGRMYLNAILITQFTVGAALITPATSWTRPEAFLSTLVTLKLTSMLVMQIKACTDFP